MLVSMSDLALWTGIDRRKIKRLLADLPSTPGPKQAKMYESKNALRVLYTGEKEVENADQRLTTARAEMQELQLDQARGELISRADVVQGIQEMFGAVRTRLLSLPAKASPEVALLSKPTQCKKVLSTLVNESLDELSTPRFLGG